MYRGVVDQAFDDSVFDLAGRYLWTQDPVVGRRSMRRGLGLKSISFGRDRDSNQDVHGIDLDGHVIRAGEVIGPGISAVAVRTNSRAAISMPKAEIIKSSDPRLITTSRHCADEDDRAYLGTRPPEWIVKDISPNSKAGATHGR